MTFDHEGEGVKNGLNIEDLLVVAAPQNRGHFSRRPNREIPPKTKALNNFVLYEITQKLKCSTNRKS